MSSMTQTFAPTFVPSSGCRDLAQLEGRVGKPGETFRASFDPEAELNWRDERFGPFAGGSFGRIFEGLFEEEGARIDGAVFGCVSWGAILRRSADSQVSPLG